jgi:uncharacterized protein with PIN domain
LILFLDTSALVKLYIAEPGSERMREAAARAERPATIPARATATITTQRRNDARILTSPPRGRYDVKDIAVSRAAARKGRGPGRPP